MAVGANDIALLHLGQDVFPRPLAHALADAESFFSQMIKLQDERVVLPAIGAGVFTKEGHEIGSALGNDSFPAPPGGIDVALLVTGIMLVLVGGPTWPAIVIALPERFPPPSKINQRLLLVAAPADPHQPGRYRYEQTFPLPSQAADGN